MTKSKQLRQLHSQRRFRDIWLGLGIMSYWIVVMHISFLNATNVTISLTGDYFIGVMSAFFVWAFTGVAVLNIFASLRPKW